MRRIIWILALLSATLFGRPSMASEPVWFAPNQTGKFALFINPRTCEVKEFGEYCQTTIYASGPNNNNETLCLHEELNPTPLWCGTLNARKTLLIQRNVQKNKVYRLVHNDNVMASADIKVAVFQPVKLRKRRRYGLGL